MLYYHNKLISDDFWKVPDGSVSHLRQVFLSKLDCLAKEYPIQCLELYSVHKCFFFAQIDL